MPGKRAEPTLIIAAKGLNRIAIERRYSQRSTGEGSVRMATLMGDQEAGEIDRSATTADLAQALAFSLDGLLAMGEMLGRQPLAETARDQLNAMLQSGRRMARLLDDALDARFASGAPALESLNLRDVVDDVEAFWRSRQSDGGNRLLISCAFQPDVRVMADPARLRRLMNMMIADSLESTGRGVLDMQLTAVLEDSGDLLFQGRLDCMGAPAAGNTGRLELCRALAGQMNGEVLEATPDDGGDKISFALRLPQAAEELEADAEEEEGPLPPTHLLIVDDNATNRMVAAALCTMFGCTSETAEDGLEAVTAVRARSFDLILMDIKMPRMDGLEATKAIRALPGAAAKTPIVALTANADPEAVATYLACGMVAVVDKPIKPAQLLSALQQALQTGPQAMAHHAPAA